MRRIADENNFKFAVICFPVSFQVEAVFNGDYPQKMLKNICSSLEIPFLDILPYMRSGKESDMFYDHCHLNFNGNKLVANRIKQFLDRLIMDKKL